MTVNQQFEIYIEQIAARKRSPTKARTIDIYRSYWENWIRPQIGSIPVADVENGTMRKLVAHLAAAGLGPSTIAGIQQVVKGIVSSALDENGNELYPRKWNGEFIDAPIVDPKAQKAPILKAQEVATAISRADSQYGPLLALLAGSGLRINEALALKVGPQPSGSYWDPGQAKIVVRAGLYQGKEQTPKTPAGVREVDLAPELNDYLMDEWKKPGSEMGTVNQSLFINRNKKTLRLRTVYDVAEKLGIPGFHSFRRFRMTHLENQGVPRGLMDFWMGHAGKDVHDRYVKLDKDIEARKGWASKIGLGFSLPCKSTISATESDPPAQSTNTQEVLPHTS
jgi:integrase